MNLTSIVIGLLIGFALTFLIFYFYQKRNMVSLDRYIETKTLADKEISGRELLNREVIDKEREIGKLSSDVDSIERINSQLNETVSSITRKNEELIERANLLDGKIVKYDSDSYVLQEKIDDCNKQISQLQQKELSFQNENDTLKQNIALLNTNISAYEAQQSSLLDKLSTQKEEIEKLHETSILEFEKAANRILEEKSEKFTELNRGNIDGILKPLGEKLSEFRKKVEDTYDKESKERFSLERTVKELQEQANRVSDEANNLTKALKGEAKTQGDWGEIILERVLESSGFVKDREYFLQESIEGENGNRLIPDCLVKLPGERTVIIDSKVSLVAFDRYFSAENPEDEETSIKEHLKSVNNHINELSRKKYDDLETSLDFTMMFMPIEPAFLLTLQKDPDLLSRAYSKRILIISPSNLTAVLKIVSDLWSREMQNRNALDIARRGELLYDKFVNFAESMEQIGENLDKTQDVYLKAVKQLNAGHGNLVGQAQKLKEMGVKSSKEIPSSLISHDSN